MNFNVWNIRDVLSIPSGTGMKSSNRSNAPSDQSSLTDSQFLFGSQFCPENAQSSSSSSQEFNGQSRLQNSLHISEDLNEPKVFLKYQTKPHLFSNSVRENTLPFCGVRPSGLLEQFENNKRKAKEKEESESFFNWMSKTEENLNWIQSSLSKIDENTESGMRTLVNVLKDMSKILQESSQSQYESIINALSAKCNMEQAMQKIEKMFEAKDTDILCLRSDQHLIQECLEVIKCQQNEQHQKLCQLVTFFSEQLTEIKKLASSPRLVLQMKDSTSQTSPSLTPNLCLVTEKKMYYESKDVCKTRSVQTSSPLWGKDTCITSTLVEDTQPWSTGFSTFHSIMEHEVCPESASYQTCSKTTPASKTLKCKKLNKMSSDTEFETKCSEEQMPVYQHSHEMLAVANRKKAIATSNLEINSTNNVNKNSQDALYFISQVNTCSAKENFIENPGENCVAGKNNLGEGYTGKKNSRRRKSCTTKRRKSRNVSKCLDKIYQTRSSGKVSGIEENNRSYSRKGKTTKSEQNDSYFVTQPIRQHSSKEKHKNRLVPCPTPKQTAVLKKEFHEHASLNVVKSGKAIPKWDCSSYQENCLPQYNIKYEHQTWFSPLHFVGYNAPCSSISGTVFEMKQKTKIHSHVYMLDSSDDSE